MTELLLRVDEVACALAIGRSKVYELIASGELPSLTIDRYVKVYRDDVRDAVQRNDRPAIARRWAEQRGRKPCPRT